MGRLRTHSPLSNIDRADLLFNDEETQELFRKVFADFDGIVVIPIAVFPEVVDRACHKSGQESLSRTELKAGKSLREVFDRYGVL